MRELENACNVQFQEMANTRTRAESVSLEGPSDYYLHIRKIAPNGTG